MNKYTTLLFDIDDTILDFKAGEQKALDALFTELNIKDKEKVIDDFKLINSGLWRDLENGLVTRDYVLNERFVILFKKYEKVVDGKVMEDRYRYYLNMQHEVISGAYDLLESLCKHYRLFIITNGVSETQHKRLNDAKLNKYFDGIFILEEIGFQKPMKEFFDAVVKRIPDFSLDSTLVIGDSLNADILGGANYNIDTCWFNPYIKENNTDIKPTYEIYKLSDLFKVLD
ncbi:YjjG family noncanonical pyrimidine nucleotidase [Tissierella sp. Yu-01]|uniref:YjjG family noncanonical pyrimidine nucleotidase n=1 Tax=Tissierella sp. Yu-01 TaxID=3035694 RepID=UPI00240E85D5|nr:YjjG family noncanonical pyrimidine nucleotidase [Tissierella sp. Yu-01]WFA10175.1 YjjG family noncanonical pyrimidine nucleotidase [Tissierella sp. Yu-01]